MAKNELGGVSAKVCRSYSFAITFPGERAGGARRQRTLAAQLVYIERQTGLDS
jgi:hypothetical protein